MHMLHTASIYPTLYGLFTHIIALISLQEQKINIIHSFYLQSKIISTLSFLEFQLSFWKPGQLSAVPLYVNW